MTHTYQEIVDQFVWDRPTHFNFATDILDDWAHREPEKLALLHVDDEGQETRLSFSDLKDRSSRLTQALTDLGLRAGDPVIIVLARQVAWWESVTACIRGRFVYSPGTTQLAEKDLAYRINALGAVAVITDASSAHKFDAISDLCGISN